MAAGMNARQERYYRNKIIKHAAKELTEAGELNFVTERGAIKGVGFEVYSSRLNASNGECAILLRVTGERKPEISKILKLWY